jgi:hypothetical protein
MVDLLTGVPDGLFFTGHHRMEEQVERGGEGSKAGGFGRWTSEVVEREKSVVSKPYKIVMLFA